MTDRESRSKPAGDRPRVLVVDDESGILETLEILLRNEGFSPHVALGGKAGLEQIAATVAGHRADGRSHAAGRRRRHSLGGARARSRHARDPHDGAGHAAVGDAGGERGRVLLHPEAVPQRRAASRSSGARPSTACCASRTPRSRRRSGGATGARRGRADRHQPQMARGAAARRGRRPDREHGAAHGRVGHRQGGRRALHPRPLASHGRPVPLDQLRRAARGPARERAVRPREGLVHRRGSRQVGSVHGRGRRHLLPRRDRRDDAGDAGEAAPRAPASRGDSGRRDGCASRSTRASSRRRIATSRRRSSAAISAATSSTAST